MKKFFAEFMEFAMRGNVMDMAVGVVIGAAFGKITTSLVNDVFMPLIGLLIGHAFDQDWFKLARDNPYRMFDLTSDASDAEIDQAYRRLISQYHPDKMAGVAEELREQAEKKASEINAAYDRIKTLRKRR